MVVSVTHAFVSAKSDGSDTTLVKPSDWNAAHTVTGVDLIGKKCIPIPATAMTPNTTNGAAPGTVETTTNKVMFATLDFDASTIEMAQFAIAMPDSWDEGTVSFKAVWSHAATTTNFGVVWAMCAVAISDGDAGDAAFGTARQINDTGGTTNTIYISAEPSTPVTVAGSPAAGDYVVFVVYRAATDASDTLAVDARLHAVKLFITTAAGNDA
jgi:hypothetical protein